MATMETWISPDPPVPLRRPLLLQGWKDVIFLHWPADPEHLGRFVPGPFALDTHDGKGWVSLISFRMEPLRLGGLPAVPGARRAFETHLRTYVTAPDGTRGLWFLSLDIAPLLTAVTGRFGFFLPYWWARHRFERRGDLIGYGADRRMGSVRHRVRVEAGAVLPDRALGELDHFLTARWLIYARYGPVPVRLAVEHPRWTLRGGRLLSLDQNLLSSKGVRTLEQEPLVHVSDGIHARIGWPTPIGR